MCVTVCVNVQDVYAHTYVQTFNIYTYICISTALMEDKIANFSRFIIESSHVMEHNSG